MKWPHLLSFLTEECLCVWWWWWWTGNHLALSMTCMQHQRMRFTSCLLSHCHSTDETKAQQPRPYLAPSLGDMHRFARSGSLQRINNQTLWWDTDIGRQDGCDWWWRVTDDWKCKTDKYMLYKDYDDGGHHSTTQINKMWLSTIQLEFKNVNLREKMIMTSISLWSI